MKLAVRLALASYTSIEFFYRLNIFDFLDIADEIIESLKGGGGGGR